MGKREYIDNTSTIWGFEPDLEHHSTYWGARAILTCLDGKRFVEYVWNRQSCRGYKTDIERLFKWWNKRNGACSKFFKESVHDQNWEWTDPKTGYSAAARESYGYVYIRLYGKEASDVRG